MQSLPVGAGVTAIGSLARIISPPFMSDDVLDLKDTGVGVYRLTSIVILTFQ